MKEMQIMDVYDEIRMEVQSVEQSCSERHDLRTEADWLDYIYGTIFAVPERFRSRGELRGAHPHPWSRDFEEQKAILADRPPHLIAIAQDQYRKRLVQIAALAVAAIKSFDRHHQQQSAHQRQLDG